MLQTTIRNNSMHMPYYTAEVTKSNRSRCRGCQRLIDKGTTRVKRSVYDPKLGHRVTTYYHLDPACVNCIIDEIDSKVAEDDLCIITAFEVVCQTDQLPSLTGKIGLKQLAGLMTKRHGKFRSFSFGLKKYYTPNWNWRCLMATILVCNTKELYMLDYIPKLFGAYPTPQDLVTLDGKAKMDIVTEMKKHKIKHERNKLQTLIDASRMVIEKGGVPTTREELESIKGIGKHVSAVVLAWVHQDSTFGVDLHVRRILKRFNIISDQSDRKIEALVEREVPKNLIGHFSRSLVDHGQAKCGYTTTCEQCVFKHSCPSSHLEW